MFYDYLFCDCQSDSESGLGPGWAICWETS